MYGEEVVRTVFYKCILVSTRLTKPSQNNSQYLFCKYLKKADI